jgi:hypothetical protein
MRYKLLLLVVSVAWVLAPAAAMASTHEDEGAKMKQEQEVASSFAGMAAQVALGETIFVTDRSGNEIKGELLAYSEDATAIRLRGDAGQFDLSQDQVRQVDLQYRDSAWSGALIGMAIGGGGGALIGAAGNCDTAEMCVGASAALGALVGLAAGGITDALIKGRKPVYANSQQMAAFPLQIVPVISKRHKGVLATITF